MSIEHIKQKINEFLTKFGCTDVLLEEPDGDTIIALFNANELISFKESIPGWKHTGIHLNDQSNISEVDSLSRDYKMVFSKTQD